MDFTEVVFYIALTIVGTYGLIVIITYLVYQVIELAQDIMEKIKWIRCSVYTNIDGKYLIGQ